MRRSYPFVDQSSGNFGVVCPAHQAGAHVIYSTKHMNRVLDIYH